MEETIKNADVLKIRDIPSLQESVEALERKRDWVRSRSAKITRQFSPMPAGGSGTRRAMDDTVAELDELDARYTLLLGSYLRQLRIAEKLLSGIESIQMRTFVRLMYLERLKCPEIQKRLNMSRWVFESCRNDVEKAETLADVKWHDR